MTFARINARPDVWTGKPCIRDLRFPMSRLLGLLAAGQSREEIFTDGRHLPEDPHPAWLGYSVGRWEGDDFAVETAGFQRQCQARQLRPAGDQPPARARALPAQGLRSHGQSRSRSTIPRRTRKPWTFIQPLELTTSSSMRTTSMSSWFPTRRRPDGPFGRRTEYVPTSVTARTPHGDFQSNLPSRGTHDD